MKSNSFADANMAAFGGQMAQAWQQGLEGWWKNLLGDTERMRDLGRHLAESSGARTQVGDLGRVLEALELIEQRMTQMETQVQEVASGLAAVAEHLAGQKDKVRKK
ncbi:MAG: hypothetical protein JRF33_14655 [Deltaproteobacteria bacterium]|nr:hypothetical protein [Deltaproteobacteria bacterium]